MKDKENVKALSVHITDFTRQVGTGKFTSQGCEQTCEEVGLEKVIQKMVKGFIEAKHDCI